MDNKKYDYLDSSKCTGFQVAIANHADGVLRNLPKEDQQIALRIFLRLIQFGKGAAHTRDPQSIDSLLFNELELAEVRRWLDSADASALGYSEALLELLEIRDRVIQNAKEQEQETIQREFQLLHKRIYQGHKIRRITSIAALSTAATLLTVTITLLFGGWEWQHQSEPQTDELYQFSFTETAFKKHAQS